MKSIQIPDELYDQVVKLAQADDVPVDRLVTSLVSERIAAWVRLEGRAKQGSMEKLDRVLAKVPAAEPDSFDRA